MVDILFVHPNASKKIYQDLATSNAAIEPPIWAGMLANSIRSAGFSTAIIDAEAEQLDYTSAARQIEDVSASMICFVVYGQQPSASSQNMEGAVATAYELKQSNPRTRIIFVGGHVAALPKQTLERHDCIDIICQNEGVFSLRSLCALEKIEPATLKNIKGIGYREQDGTIVLTEPETVVNKKELETILPGVAWDLLPSFDKYRTAGWHSWSNNSEKTPFAALYTSLGCPYRCSFCMINIINRTDNSEHITSANSNLFRWWNPEFIIKQFDLFAMNGVKNVKIADELFVLNPRHFITICDLIIERGYKFNIWAYSRVDTCKPEYLDKLKQAGVNWLGLGIENPDHELRKNIHKEGFAEVNILDLIQRIRAAGINVGGNYIFGLPFDTMESLESTLQFAINNPTEMANFYCAMAYPGSPLYRQAFESGIPLPQSYSGFSQHSYDTFNLANDSLTSSEILKFRDEAWDKYHSNPDYHDLMLQKFGQAAVSELNATRKIKLKRKLLGD